MPKYINADELIKAIETELWDWKTVDGIKSSTVLKQTISDIKNMPPADVVEVVRCKDCKHREMYEIFGRPTTYYCLRGCVDSNLSLNENDYCCWGERIETE